MSQTIAYIRASTLVQDINHQRHEILEFANRQAWHVDDFMEVTRSSRHTSRQRRIEELLQRLQPGDRLLVTELSRLGRSTGEVILLINQLVDHGVTLVIIKQNLHVGQGLQDMTAKVMITLLALFAENNTLSLPSSESLSGTE
ncbi:MAG: recombinase family protein [Cyanobacteria bacterium J06633_2]